MIPAEDDPEALALFRAATVVQLCDGKIAKFWTDNWLPGGISVQTMVPSLCSFVKNSGITVAAALENHRWIRDICGGLSAQAMAQYL
jgi:hypothetical protein